MVGDEMRRGISGGQKKRVTTGMLLVRYLTCLVMMRDNVWVMNFNQNYPNRSEFMVSQCNVSDSLTNLMGFA